MHNARIAVTALLALIAGPLVLAHGQAQPNPAAMIATQREAMLPLAIFDGVWRGPASMVLPSGDKYNATQTERVGPLLDGSIRVIEGRSYSADNTLGFSTFASISYDPEKKAYTLHSHALGRVGDFPLQVTPNGFVWEFPLGAMTIRYTAVVKDGVWREIGESIVPDKDPVRFFEMNLKRVGDTDWPAAGAIAPK